MLKHFGKHSFWISIKCLCVLGLIKSNFFEVYKSLLLSCSYCKTVYFSNTTCTPMPAIKTALLLQPWCHYGSHYLPCERTWSIIAVGTYAYTLTQTDTEKTAKKETHKYLTAVNVRHWKANISAFSHS